MTQRLDLWLYSSSLSLRGSALSTSFQVIFRIYQQWQFSREIVLPALLLFDIRVWMMLLQMDALLPISHEEHF